MGRILDAARKLRKAMDEAGGMLDDRQASAVPALYPGMRYTGGLIKAGTRIRWNGTLRRAAVDLWDVEENSPHSAPALWETLSYQNGFRIIPDVITAGTAFQKGECGWREGFVYESLIDANVWTPESYPAGWQRREDA